MSPSPLQSASNTATSGDTVTVTLDYETTAGNCLVVYAGAYAAESVPDITGIKIGESADNFAKGEGEKSTYTDAEIWIDPGCEGGQTSVVVTFSGSADLAAWVEEWPGIAASPADKANPGSGSSSSWSSGSSGTLAQAAEVAFGCVFAAESPAPTITGPSSPWTDLAQLTAGDGSLLAGYQVTDATTAQTYSGTFGASAYYSAVVLTLRQAAVAAAGYPLTPPSPFTPMSLPRYWTPPPQPVFGFTGSAAAAAAAASGDQSAPVFTGSPAAAAAAVSGSFATASPFPPSLLGLHVELLINGTWTDVSSYVLERQDIAVGRGRPDETQQVSPSSCTLVLANRDGRFSPSNPSGAFYPWITRNVQLRVSVTTWSAALAEYSGYRFWGEVSTWAPGWDPTGTDIYVAVTASGVLRRYSQGNATIGSALRRYYTRLGGNLAPYAYWPGEDGDTGSGGGGSSPDQIASGLSGGTAMGFSGTPGFGSDTSFGGSDGIPDIAGSAWHGQTAAASSPPGAGSLTADTAGTFSFTPPPGVTSVDVTQVTGGGGGGGAAGPTAGGGGGAGGGTSKNSSVGVTPGETYEYVVGAGGQAGTAQGTQGTAGGDSSWTGDTQAVTGGGGQGGLGGDTSTGGDGGTGTYAGGAGADGSADETTSGSQYLQGYTGPFGGADGGTAAQQSVSWPAPDGVTSASVSAAGGAGGGQGGGAYGEGYGGGGGGGGGLASGTIETTPGSSYTFYAGNGGAGGSLGDAGQTGAESAVSGDNGTSVTSHGGDGGSGAGGGGDGGGDTGSPGGDGARAETGEGMGGGGGGGGGGGANGDGGNGGGGSAGAESRPPGAGGGNGSGGGWGAVSNGGSGVTPGGTGAAGVPGRTAPGGGGGGGAATNSSGASGGGGGAGWIQWSWEYTGPVGGGGGGSAGPDGAGSAGNVNGTGGEAVTDGGAGGDQGTAGSAPGGGGGGGIPANAITTTVTAPGNGAPGLVSFSWSGGSVSPVAADIVRFLLDVDSGGGTQPSYDFTATDAGPCVFTAAGSTYADGTPVQLTGASLPPGGNFSPSVTYYVVDASTDTFSLADTPGGTGLNSSGTGSGSVQSVAGWVIARAVTYGTVAHIDCVYDSSGTLELIGYGSGGSVLFDSGAQAFGLNGQPVMVDMELTANADGTEATWTLSAIQPGADTAIATYTGTVSDVSVGYVSDVYIAPNGDVTFASAGQISVQTYADPLTALGSIISGYNGELAADRLSRLASEEGFGFALAGNASDTPMMGPQQDDTFTNVIQSCEDMDQGQVYEPRDSFGLAYRTRVSMQGQNPALTMDYSLQQLANKLEPVADDQYTRNDIQVTRNNGSSVTATLASGAMSIQEPPNGVGDYTYQLTVYGYADSQLANLAAWMLTVGTVADERYPLISADLARAEVTGLFAAVAGLDVGDYIQVINPPVWLVAAPISQLAWGFTERLNSKKWTIDYNAVPESPYSEGNPPTW